MTIAEKIATFIDYGYADDAADAAAQLADMGEISQAAADKYLAAADLLEALDGQGTG